MKRELDLIIYKLQTYIPGFYPGCTMEIVNLDHWCIKSALGKIMTASTDLNDLRMALQNFETGKTNASISQGNEHEINYHPQSLKVISISEELRDFITTVKSAIRLTESLNPKFSAAIRDNILSANGEGMRYGEKAKTFSENLEDVSKLVMDWVSWAGTNWGAELSSMYTAAQNGLFFFKDRTGNYQSIFNKDSDKRFTDIISKFRGAPEIQNKIIQNYSRPFLGSAFINSAEALVRNSFSWEVSPEGRKEWVCLAQGLEARRPNVSFCSVYYDCTSGYPVEYRRLPDHREPKLVVNQESSPVSNDLVICDKFRVGDIICLENADYKPIMPQHTFGKIDSVGTNRNAWYFTFETSRRTSWRSGHEQYFRHATAQEKEAFERLNILDRPVKIEEIKDEVHNNYIRLRGSGLRLEEFEMSSAIAELSSISPIFIKKETVQPFTVTEEEVKIKIKSKQPIKISVK